MTPASAKRRGNLVARIVIDCLLAACFVAVMATALIAEAPHEYLGIALFVLMVAHIVVNRRWFTTLARGRYSAVRVFQVATVAGLALCVVGQVVSAVVLSEHALGFLPAIPGASWARQVHMLCSYWSFVFAFAHAGLQVKGVLARVGFTRVARPGLVWALRILWALVAAFGVASFAHLGMGDYLIARVQFAAADYASPLWLVAGRYAAVAALVAGAFHYLRVVLERAK